ncbi:MAG: DUF1232 domain-containing protein [Firmicutes bacterium]|nr:DUF1232 domain-containing protein [Bacillota bacterium]
MEYKELENRDYNDFYKALRKDIDKFLKSKKGKKYEYGEYLLIVPDMFYLLCRLIMDKEIPKTYKAMLLSTIAYFILVVDFFPEAFIGPPGFIDDLALAAFVLNRVINKTSNEIIEKYWIGDKKLLPTIKSILKVSDDILGSGLMKKLKKLSKRK